jgi:hypothetical protein
VHKAASPEFLDRVIRHCQDEQGAAVAELSSRVRRFRSAYERAEDPDLLLFLAYDVSHALRAVRNVGAALIRLEAERATDVTASCSRSPRS